MSGYYAQLASEVAKHLRHDETVKQRLAVRVARLGFAFDGTEAEMSAKEFAAKLLAKLGLKPADDPVAALDSYLTGRDMGERERAKDNGSPMPFRGRDFNIPGGQLTGAGMDAGDSFIDRYINGT